MSPSRKGREGGREEGHPSTMPDSWSCGRRAGGYTTRRRSAGASPRSIVGGLSRLPDQTQTSTKSSSSCLACDGACPPPCNACRLGAYARKRQHPPSRERCVRGWTGLVGVFPVAGLLGCGWMGCRPMVPDGWDGMGWDAMGRMDGDIHIHIHIIIIVIIMR